MEYEINFLVLQSNTGQLEEAKSDIRKLIEKREGKITDSLEYKKRKLAYKIKHEQYGFYNVFRFTVEGNETIEKIKKDINLLKTVARYIIIKADELPSLKEETPQDQEKSEMASKNIVKQEDVRQLISDKKVTAPVTSPKSAQRKDEKQDVSAKKTEEEEKPSKQEETAKEKETEEKKEDKQQPEKKEEDKRQGDKPSLDDLDKKLDEILNS